MGHFVSLDSLRSIIVLSIMRSLIPLNIIYSEFISQSSNYTYTDRDNNNSMLVQYDAHDSSCSEEIVYNLPIYCYNFQVFS